jgi:hypothetical protein
MVSEICKCRVEALKFSPKYKNEASLVTRKQLLQVSKYFYASCVIEKSFVNTLLLVLTIVHYAS